MSYLIVAALLFGAVLFVSCLLVWALSALCTLLAALSVETPT
jgi:hypothetical protein